MSRFCNENECPARRVCDLADDYDPADAEQAVDCLAIFSAHYAVVTRMNPGMALGRKALGEAASSVPKRAILISTAGKAVVAMEALTVGVTSPLGSNE